jgi:predicted ATPase
MLIQFKNLGRLHTTELDLRPLTVIIGPNNSNKTYVAYSIYGLLSSLRSLGFSVKARVVGNRISDETIAFEIAELKKFVEAVIEQGVREFHKQLGVFFQDSSGKLFSDTTYKLQLTDSEIFSIVSQFAQSRAGTETDGERFSLDGSRLLYHSSLKEPEVARFLDPAEIIQYFLPQIGFPKPYLFPAERNAFIITYKVLANRRLKLLLAGQRQAFSYRHADQRQMELLRESGEIRYPQPVEDFLQLLTDIEIDRSTKEQTAHPFRSAISRSVGGEALAAMIEKTVQGTNATVYKQTALGGSEIMVRLKRGFEIDLYNASSSIKQLAPLLLYLRYRAQANDLLIIDEPEMNLHPESQVKLLEILAVLVNQGVRILLTTHSPYIMAHLNNLVCRADTSELRRKQAKTLFNRNPDALLDISDVSAYEVADQELRSLKDPEFGIRWDTLSDVAVDVQQRYFKLFDNTTK